MIKSVMLSRFTPSLLEPDVLEAIFVRREKLASRLVELVRESALTENRHYVLLVGPRGIGKTHLVSLVYHRLRQDAALAEGLRVAWLREEEWAITSYLDLLLAVLRALGEQHPDLAQRSEALVGLPAEQAELEAEKAIRDCAGARTVLLIAENLDEIFRGLGEEGQRKLRAFIQNRPVLTILATSTSLFGGVSLRTSPFYGFFEVHHLDELPFEDAVSLLVKIAEHEGDKQLAARLTTPAGRARIRALHHLAGGNPRVYVIFSQFLTCESLDQLTDAVLRTLDDLTPYYQARMNFLSPQQRKIVSFLCDRRGAVPVGEIAAGNFLSHQGASSQLKKLREFGYVRAHQVGRESYYELREPLMRLAMEVKKTRGRPLGLLIEFLGLWYTRDELTDRAHSMSPEDPMRAYVVDALRAWEDRGMHPSVEACLCDYARHMEQDEYAQSLQAVEEALSLSDDAVCWLLKGFCLANLGRHEDAVSAFGMVSQRNSQRDVEIAASIGQAFSLFSLGSVDKAIAAWVHASHLHWKPQVESAATPVVVFHDHSMFQTDREVTDSLRRILVVDVDAATKGTRLAEVLKMVVHKRESLFWIRWELVESIPFLFDVSVAPARARTWLQAWERAACDYEEFALPLRLLRAAVEYRETKDKRVLLRLPVEEREILQPLLPE